MKPLYVQSSDGFPAATAYAPAGPPAATGQTRPVDEYHHRLAATFAAARSLFRTSLGILRRFSLSNHQFMTMLELPLHGGSSPNITQLANSLQIRHNSMVSLLDSLSSRGYLERVRSSHDRRNIHIRLTRLGRAVLDDVVELHRQELHGSVEL